MRYFTIISIITILFLVSCEKKALSIPNVEPVKSKEKALELAKADLSYLKFADKLEITTIDKINGNSTTVVNNKKDIQKIFPALTIEKRTPSPGMPLYYVKWICKEKPIREIWVYESGEWGFRRPETSWTTGLNSELPIIIKRIKLNQ